MLQHKTKEGKRRAELVNRVRTSRLPAEGEVVMLRDPKRSKVRVGHRPGRLPAEGPFEVKTAHGSVVELQHFKTGAVPAKFWGNLGDISAKFIS